MRELFQRLREELAQAPALELEWQIAETRINLYLFVCAIACTVEDYLARRPPDLSSLVSHFPQLRAAASGVAWLLDRAQAVRLAFTDRRIARWQREWERCVDGVCDLLVRESEPTSEAWTALRAALEALSTPRFPERLWSRRMPLPAAFRNQDLTHYDVIALARGFMTARADPTHPLAVIGLRTAGAYFAPLVKAQLSTVDPSPASWMTIRSKQGLSSQERRRLRALGRADGHVVLVDEPPNSGATLELTLGVLKRCGVSPDRVTILVPRSPARPNWTPMARAGEHAPHVITLDPPDYHKARLLEPASAAAVLREYCGSDVSLVEDAAVRALNTALQARHRDGFHVRRKRVFELQGRAGAAAPRRVLAKSVGWGWLGYHAYLAGTRLAGMVPQVIGLRHGLLFTEWVGEPNANRAPPSVSPRTLAAYVAARARRLRIGEDPCFDDLAYGRSGWTEIINLLRRAYGRYLNRAKIPLLHRRLRRFLSPMPALIDGRMRPEDWVANGTALLKADFEHHSFGKTELNVVDPAFDLAGTVFAFELSADAEQQLLDTYVRETGDSTVADRLLLYKLLHGVLAIDGALGGLARDSAADARHEWNRRYLAARNFLTWELNRYCGQRLATAAGVTWSRRLLFLDLDGVLDCEVFGFPHTTASGLAALDLLRAHGFSVVPHTGRSVAEARRYCEAYHLPGAIGELGSVFIDAVAGREVPFVTEQAAAQLARCREAVAKLPSVCVDPWYRYSIRAYRFRGERTVPLDAAEIRGLLTQHGFDRLTSSPSSVDTIILQHDIDKGQGLVRTKQILQVERDPVAAIGDADRDVPMLERAEFAFAPAGCSRGVRALAARGKCHVLREPMQRGLLAAAQRLVRGLTPTRGLGAPVPRRSPAGDLVESLLQAAERPPLRQFLSALNPWAL